MISIGLDLSISSTGICVHDTEGLKPDIYYIVGSKFTNKAIKYLTTTKDDIPDISFIMVNKKDLPKDGEYHEKEAVKTENIYEIARIISDIIGLYSPDICTIEGISFSSRGSVLDLCGLNYMVRMILKNQNVPHIYIVSPTQNKKYATGNGQAEKDVMISAWCKIEPTACNIPSYVKIDDLADACFLSRYGEHIEKQS